jgi:formimidoylglutamate deiminase
LADGAGNPYVVLMPLLVPDLIYRAGAFHAGLALDCDERTGRITRVVPRAELDREPAGGRDPAVHRLPGRALLPGFVNAHSHAFQRLIRGRTHWRPAADPHGAGAAASFWTWREAMYGAALRLTAADVYDTARFCFVEMLRAGITTVGEFHYLHNDERGRPYADPAELGHRVIAAADAVGIRIRLLNVCYAAAGIGEPLRPEQRRFATADLDAFIGTTLSLQRELAGRPLAGVGIAPHSIRAVPRDWLPALHAAAAANDMPLHMHVSEQPAEVDACVAAYGMRPVRLLHADGVLDSRFTAVHATHIDDDEVRMLAQSGATVCACPATERDLGDGFLRAADLLRDGGTIALGTDSQTTIDMFDEARLTEYMERSRRLERVVLTRAVPVAPVAASPAQVATTRHDVAPVLIDMMTVAGARSLHVDAGMLEAGMLADIVAVDLDHHVLAGWTTDSLPAMLALSAHPAVVTDVWVGGRQVVAQRRHESEEDAVRSFNETARRIARA